MYIVYINIQTDDILAYSVLCGVNSYIHMTIQSDII